MSLVPDAARRIGDTDRLRAVAVERVATWRWPAVQIAGAAALGYLLARWVAPDAASYAPITAIATMGLGRQRRPERGIHLVVGMIVGALLAELAARTIGLEWWGVGLLMGVSALIAGLVLDEDLVVTYAAINAGVLLAVPGSDGWIPTRVIAGTMGIVATMLFMLVVLPPNPVHQLGQRLDAMRSRATSALEATSDELSDRSRPDHLADDRVLITAGRDLDDEIARSRATSGHARQITRWAPLRRRQRDEVARLDAVAKQLRPALRTVSTIARLGDRMLLHEVRAATSTTEALDDVALWVDRVVRSLVFDDLHDRPDGDDIVGRLRSSEVGHAAEVALCEEIRGLVADLTALVDERLDGAVVDPGRDLLGERDQPAVALPGERET